MNKALIIERIIDSIEADLAKTTAAALESAESATHEESRSEGKYDTRGLETSYLATGQAQHALELRGALASTRAFSPPEFDSSSPIALGALVQTLSSQGRELFFLAPAYGGTDIQTGDKQKITVISPKSPIGRELIGSKVGDRLSAGGGKTVLQVW